MEVEIWKDVPEYKDLYMVSSLGNVKSLPRNTTRGVVLKPNTNSNGYLYVVLYKNGKQRTFTVHILVAMAFLNHKPNGTKELVADHIDNNHINNNIKNIKLISHRENTSKDQKNKSSRFTGVSWDKKSSKWEAIIYFKGRSIHIGLFILDIEASNAYQKAKNEAEQGLDLNIIYPKRIKTSKYIGVSFDKTRNKWISDYKGKYLGRFNTEIEAHEARENYIKNLK